MLPNPLPCEQTDTCENSTFPRGVKSPSPDIMKDFDINDFNKCVLRKTLFYLEKVGVAFTAWCTCFQWPKQSGIKVSFNPLVVFICMNSRQNAFLNYGIIQNPQFKLCYNPYEMAKYIVLCLTGLIETLQIHIDETFVVYFMARMFQII